MVARRYQTTVGTMEMCEDGIIRFRVFSGATMDTALAEECVTGASELSGNRRHLLLIDMRDLRSITRDARRVFNAAPASAVALLVGSPVSKVIGSFFLGFNKPSYPLKLFTSEARALEWLMDYKE